MRIQIKSRIIGMMDIDQDGDSVYRVTHILVFLNYSYIFRAFSILVIKGLNGYLVCMLCWVISRYSFSSKSSVIFPMSSFHFNSVIPTASNYLFTN